MYFQQVFREKFLIKLFNLWDPQKANPRKILGPIWAIMHNLAVISNCVKFLIKSEYFIADISNFSGDHIPETHFQRKTNVRMSQKLLLTFLKYIYFLFLCFEFCLTGNEVCCEFWLWEIISRFVSLYGPGYTVNTPCNYCCANRLILVCRT